MKAIELKNVTFSYNGSAKVLDDVDYSAEYGEVSLLSGHSGAGKSTFMHIVSGIIPNVNFGELSGDVIIDGENIKGKKLGDVCRKVGVVMQNADEQIVQKRVEDEIAFGCENLAFPPQKIKFQIDVACRLMEISPEWNCRVLSGGQKQRLITASTLAMGQKILVLDEPLANLDKDGARNLMQTLRELASSGYCVIVIEHRLDMVMPYVDKVWHAEKGKIFQIENTELYLSAQTARISDSCNQKQHDDVLFRLDKVAFCVKNKQILNDVTCEIPNGGRTVLLGENGCGKTTLLRLLARLCKPSDGKIVQYIDAAFDRVHTKRKWFRRVGVVYQNPDYQLFMPTVKKEIEFGATGKEYAEKIAKMFGVYDLYGRHPQSLSEGQKRRVSIAAVMAGKPEVLLLDEPTVGQDYDGLCELVNVLNSLHEETGNTMITVTHDVRCAEALCDRAILIEDGKAAKTGGKNLVREYFAR